jgi:molybdate transport system substrate-binding protein
MIRRYLIHLLLVAVVVSGCNQLNGFQDGSSKSTPGVDPAKEELVVFAASSLTDAFQALATQFEALHPETRIILNFASTQQLAIQLAQGAEADVFASADLKHMLDIEKAGRIDQGVEQNFVNNWLVVLIPNSNPGSITELADLTKPGLKVILVDKAVPAGAYALEILDQATQDPAYGNDFKSSVLNNVVSYEANVRALVSKIALGEADAGIAYSSDGVGSAADQVRVIAIPPDFNVKAQYFIGKVNDSAHPAEADQFIDFILSKEGQAVLKDYGFIPIN